MSNVAEDLLRHRTDRAMRAADYLMEDPRESGRLAAKVNADDWVERYCAEILRRYPPCASVLDVGCGPGVLASVLACRTPAATVCGVDRSADRMRALKSDTCPNIRRVQGDARSLAFPGESFDFVYSRFLLEYLSDRKQAVDEMVRVCKRGGTVLLQDLDGQLLWHYPEDPELQALTLKVLEGLQSTGFDPFIGRKLFSLVRGAGLTNIDVKVEGYHVVAGRINDHDHALWDTKLDIALPAITQVIGSAALARDLKRRFMSYLQRDDTLTYSVVFTVSGMKS